MVPPDTNIVMVDLLEGQLSSKVADKARKNGVLALGWNDTRVRCVFHLDVDDAATDLAAEVMTAALAR